MIRKKSKLRDNPSFKSMEKENMFACLLLCSIFITSTINAHEIFSLRADIARQGGFNEDLIIKTTRASKQKNTEFLNRIMYGITEYLTSEIRLPIFLENKIPDIVNGQPTALKALGLGKIEALAKIRLYKKYAFQERNQIIAALGILFPTASPRIKRSDGKPILENRSMDFLFGLAGAFETTMWYHFFSTTYRLNTRSHGIREGDQITYSYAVGYRPEAPDVKKVDWVFLFDVDGIITLKDALTPMNNKNTGGYVLFFGPSLFCSKNNVMLKGGIQAPLFDHVNGMQEKNSFRAMVGLFVQF